MTSATSSPNLSQFEKQLELLTAFNLQVPCNPQGDFAVAGFKTLLESLKTTKISDSYVAPITQNILKNGKIMRNGNLMRWGV